MEKHHGRVESIKHHKEVERHVLMYMMNQPSLLKQRIWTKLDHKGLPKWLNFNHNLVKDDNYVRGVNTSLAYYRLYSLSPDDTVINSITDVSSHSISVSEIDKIREYSEAFFKQRNVPEFTISDNSPIYATTKAGANSSSAMGVGSIDDALAISETPIKECIDKILPLVYTEEKVKLFQSIFDDSLAQSVKTDKPLLTGRLHLISEGGGKTRPIAIPDIWSQSVLKPIHNYLMNLLKRMPNDGTFSHSALAERVKAFTFHHSLYCYDLTAATDRLPLFIQKEILRPLLGEIVDWWAKLMSEREFTYKGKSVTYAVGQPMGLLSSWPAMALAHHIIINYVKKDKSFYAVIGDDMVMHRPEAALEYRRLMESLGVEIKLEKTLIPSSNEPKVANIAKRYFRNGIDISPIPPKVLIESTKNLEGFIEFLEVLASRTSKFQDSPDISWSDAINSIWKTNRDYCSEEAQAVVSCPIVGYFPFIDNNRKPMMLLTELPLAWDSSKYSLIKNLLDQFLEREIVQQLNKNETLLKVSFEAQGMTYPNLSPGPNEIGVSPILRNYLSVKDKEITKKLERYVGNYMGFSSSQHSEVNAYAPLPRDVLDYLLSEPDPRRPKDFMVKRRIRRKRGLSLIQKFWKQNRRMISKPV